MMLSIDRYTRLLAKQRSNGKRAGDIVPNSDGLLDLGYLQELSS
jgi:hypothetical protein